ncbi:MAG: hypothetical protein JWN68_3423 [Nocardioides sp.]|nr:hypothetical protein [Nocardioides sp.]
MAAPPAEVWSRVVTPEGINHELGPVVRMRMPRRWRGSSIEDLSLDESLGWAWLLLFGVLPFDADRLRLTEVVPGRLFQERSTLLSARRWDHRREVVASSAGTRVSDVLEVEGRPLTPTFVVALVATTLFRHRHRRLRAHFGVVAG